jgi:MFS superfamily sulfate permease-like transporter
MRGIRFDRNELAGSFGDIGTDLPLIVGIIMATGMDSASIFIVFGLLQIATGFIYRIPMPAQPLKVMAVLVITQKIEGGVLMGAGLAIGATVLLLALSGALDLLVKWTPRCVVRGIQFGLGLSLASVALRQYIPSQYIPSMYSVGYALAGGGLLAMLLLWGNRKVPPGLLVIAIGVVYALATGLPKGAIADAFGVSLPTFHRPRMEDILTGFVVLALPQLPLSLSNSVIATEQTIRDLFPERKIGARKIGLTYGVMNLIAPLFGGIPVCHGAGGLAGHYTFGARTGGSVIIYGTLYVVLGLFFGRAITDVVKIFPLPILGIVLLFEALTLLALIRDQAQIPRNLYIALLVGIVAFAVPQGYLVGLVLGVLLYYGFRRFGPPFDGNPEQTASHPKPSEERAGSTAQAVPPAGADATDVAPQAGPHQPVSRALLDRRNEDSRGPRTLPAGWPPPSGPQAFPSGIGHP